MNTENEKKLDQVIDKLRQTYRRIPGGTKNLLPATLYHYTSAAGLHGIVSTGVLRASDFSYLNDSTEVKYGIEVVRQVIADQLKNNSAPHIEGLLDHAETLHLENLMLEEDIERWGCYLACFCTKPDLLGQWRGYGGAKERFCIGFNFEDRFPSLDRRDSLGRAIYDDKEQRRRITSTIACAVEALRDIGGAVGAIFAVELFIHQLIKELSFFKHPSFAEEHEWRIVHQYLEESLVEFDTSGGILKPYVNLKGPLDKSAGGARLPIAEVIVGASNMISESLQSVKLLLARYGYQGVKASASKVPLRQQ